jgi:hypothetical protein
VWRERVERAKKETGNRKQKTKDPPLLVTRWGWERNRWSENGVGSGNWEEEGGMNPRRSRKLTHKK